MRCRPTLLLCSALFPAWLGACRSDGERARPGRYLESGLLDVAEEARRQLGVTMPPARETASRLTALAAAARRVVGDERGPAAVVELNEFFFGRAGFRREVADRDLRFSLLPRVLENRRGSCLGLAGLYLVLARRLGLPVNGVLVPGHFFLRLGEGPGHVNIELLRKGENMPEEWYRHRWQVPPAAGAYLRALEDDETLAVLHFNLGNEYRRRGHLRRALRHYRRAVEDFPDFAEAQASLGLVFQLLGQRRRALAAYRRALGLQPGLPGLQGNLAVLLEEMSAPVSAATTPEQQQPRQQQ